MNSCILQPKDAVIAITYICNSRCIMCNIWQIKDLPQLAVEEYLKLPASLRDINISGCEPFLRPDMVQAIRNIVKACPKARLIISTNGFSTDLIVSRMKEILKIKPDVGVSVSIDGVGDKQIEVRRIPDGFNKCIATLKALRGIGVKHLKIGFTAGDYNIDHMEKMYRLAKEMGVEFTLAALHNSENYFHISTNRIQNFAAFDAQFKYVIQQELKTWNPKRWARAYFTHGLRHYIKTHRRILPDYGGRLSCYLDPDGYVYPADVSTRCMGRMQDFKTFTDLWSSPKAQQVRQGNDPPHWMICTARSAMKQHWLRVGWWILWNKFRISKHEIRNKF